MRAAADLEDNSTKHIAMENRLYPMRELLGDLLLQQQQPSPALTEYETSLQSTPNRLRGLYGAAKAAEGAGQQEKAATYFRKLPELTTEADADRVEIPEDQRLFGTPIKPSSYDQGQRLPGALFRQQFGDTTIIIRSILITAVLGVFGRERRRFTF